MKIKLLGLLFFIILSANAQTTHHLDWRIGIGTLDLTIDVGDTVIWTWKDTMQHNVESDTGSVETFTSADLSGNGQTYTYIFTVIGTNPYICRFHPGNMNGTITVQAVMGINDFDLNTFSISPNPGSDRLNLKLSKSSNNTLEVFDVLGKKIYSDRVNNITKSVDVSQWNSGVYLVRITSDTGTQTKRFVKQ